MKNFFISWAISSLFAFVDISIKNPKSKDAIALAQQLQALYVQLGILLNKWKAEGIILAD